MFSSLFAASKTFPKYLGVASSASMALFGLSPLFLSVLASNFFSHPDKGLDVTHFLKFHAIVAGCIHIIGAVNLRLPSADKDQPRSSPIDDPEQATEPDERSALLPGKPPNDISVHAVSVEENSTALDLLRDRKFWMLFIVSLLILGCVSCSKSIFLQYILRAEISAR